MALPFSIPARNRSLPVAVAAAVCCLAAVAARGAEIVEGFEGPETSWQVVPGSLPVARHDRAREGAHRGEACERFSIDVAAGTPLLRLRTPIGPAAVIDELRGGVWVRCSRPDVRLSFRVRMPAWVSKKTGQPVEVLVPGGTSRDLDRWEWLEAAHVPAALAQQLPALHMEHGPGTITGAVATHLVLDVPPTPGHVEVAIDDMRVGGVVAAQQTAAQAVKTMRDSQLQPASATGSPPVDPPAGLARGILEVDGRPFFPRSIDWSGEPLAALAALGFNCVRFGQPATLDQLAEARQAGLWVICPPPVIPDVDVQSPESLPALRNWDRVLMWDMGSGLSEDDIQSLAERGRRVRACDIRQGRPLIGAADSGLRSVSRHLDMLVARKTVLGTSLELVDYLTWLRERPRLARPGTPLLTTISTEIDPRAARQAAALAGIGGRGLAVDGESLGLAALSAVAAGTKGILFTSTRPLDGDDREARMRAAACREMNMRMRVLEPWGAAGRFAAPLQTSSPEVQAYVMEAARARVVIAWRCVQGSQIVARRYHGGDVPSDAAPLTILVTGVPESHQPWAVAPGGLRPLRHQRVTGGMAVTLDDFLTQATVLLSGEPAVTGHVQDLVRTSAPFDLESARALASAALGDAGDLLGRLPPQAFSGPPPVAAAAMLAEAGRLAAEGESLAASDPATATEKLRRAAAIAGQFERRIWENGIKAEGSFVSSPLTASDATAAEEWQFVAARGSTTPGPEMLAGGGMEDIEELAGGGWRHFARANTDIRTLVEVSRTGPAAGRGSLRLVAQPASPDEPPVVVETPPLWITTPPLAAPPGKLVEITASVLVPKPITGSVDGLFVFDSLGGPALGERVGATRGWRRLVLHRIVPPEAVEEPLVVTFALTGLGEARIDEVSIRVLERTTTGGVPAAQVSAPRASAFPAPADLLVPPPRSPAAVAAPAASAASAATPAWPGMNLEWPSLVPFGQSSNAPPERPDGGTVDPFKRARTTTPAP